VREFDVANLLEPVRVGWVVVDLCAGGRDEVEEMEVVRVRRDPEVDDVKARGFGVVLVSADGSLLFRTGAGVLIPPILGSGREASDMGGDGGSWRSEAASSAERALRSGGVIIIGELAVE
jgi:hypothetical protein